MSREWAVAPRSGAHYCRVRRFAMPVPQITTTVRRGGIPVRQRSRRQVQQIAGGLIGALIVAAAASAPVEGSSAFAASPAALTAHTTSGPIHFKATGFFHTGFAHGRWWLVTPDGQPFYSSAVDHVSANPDTDQRTGQCPFCNTIASEYPNVSDWAAATATRLQSWGFNTIGSFSDYASFASHMPYTELLSMASGNDWFASSFATNAESVAQSQVAPLANDPNLIGWYTDSELHWGPDWRSSHVVLDDYLALPSGSPGLTVAMRYRHNPNAFVRVLAARYFSVTTAAIHHYDPHHLILGVNAPAQLIQPELLKVARHYVDVFSIDDYALIPGLEQTIQQTSPQYLDPAPNLSNIEQIVNKPLMMGEYGFRAADSGLPNTWPPIFPTFATQADRAAAYETFLTTMYASPWVVGDAWFEYVDEPAGGRTGDGENSNWGLVSVTDVPYQTMVSAVEAMHARAPAPPPSH
jgi:hypothetical protein